MSTLTSPTKAKFLLDENVKKRLARFLSKQGYEVIVAPIGAPDYTLAERSKSDHSVLVTNDVDFANVSLSKNKIFSMILLKIPQDEPESLLKAFASLLSRKSMPKDFEGNLIILRKESFELLPLDKVQ